MLHIGIADIHKTPSLIDKLDDVATIVNKKTKDIKFENITTLCYNKIKKG